MTTQAVRASKRIHKITIKRMVDESPDTSYLGEFSNDADTPFAINHRERSGEGSRVFEWFNPQCNDNAEDAERDYQRMLALDRGEFCYIGIRADAEIVTAGVCQKITSGGLWGTESDSDEAYLKDLENEQLAELKEQLAAIGFSKRAIAAAFKDVEQAD